MDIYFVRHGETDGNVAKRHQHPDISLNERGKEQATRVATVVADLEPTHLVTSTNKRAIETTREIALLTGLMPETVADFEELHRPEWLIGHRLYERATISYVIGWFFGMKSSTMHDGETYEGFRQRIKSAESYLKALPKDSRVVVVSHSIFINFFLEHMNREGRMSFFAAARRFSSVFRLKNTSVTHLQYDGIRWRIVDRF
jgi:2,3-bisphosphoglycerate-dependent phosphoglycerate mutase